MAKTRYVTTSFVPCKGTTASVENHFSRFKDAADDFLLQCKREGIDTDPLEPGTIWACEDNKESGTRIEFEKFRTI